MLPVFQTTMEVPPAAPAAETDPEATRHLSQRFARVLTLRHRQRQRVVHPSAGNASTRCDETSALTVSTSNHAGRRRRTPTKSRNCAALRRELQRLAAHDSRGSKAGARKRRASCTDRNVGGSCRGDESERSEENTADREMEDAEDMELDATIRSLQAHITSLERSKLLRDSAVVMWRANRAGVALDLSREYFLQFMHGFDPEDWQRSASTSRFMASVFRPDVLCRDFQGLQAFMDQWEKYTTFHRGLTLGLNDLRLVSGEGDAECVTIYASAQIKVTFTMDTLKFLYPSLFMQALQDPQASAIMDALVGHEGTLPMELVLHFDDEGRVFAFESRVDLVTSLLKLLHNPTAAIKAYESSLMTTDGHWKVAQDAEAMAQRERLLPRQLL